MTRSKPPRPHKTITTDTMKRVGKRMGKTRRFQFGWPLITTQIPSPDADATELPPPVDECRAIALDEMQDVRIELSDRKTRLAVSIADDKKRVDQLLQELGGGSQTPEKRFAYGPYIAVFVLIAAAEYAVNSLVFQILGSGRLETQLFALGMAVALPLLAHFIGSNLKQHRHLPMTVLFTAAVLLILIGVVALRAFYFDVSGASGVLGLNVSPLVMTLLFLLINLGIVSAAIGAAYMRAYSDPVREANIVKLSETRARLRKSEAELNALPTQYEARCNQANSKFRELADAFQEANTYARRRGAGARGDRMQWYPPRDIPVPSMFAEVDRTEQRAAVPRAVVAPEEEWVVSPSLEAGPRPQADLTEAATGQAAGPPEAPSPFAMPPGTLRPGLEESAPQ